MPSESPNCAIRQLLIPSPLSTSNSSLSSYMTFPYLALTIRSPPLHSHYRIVSSSAGALLGPGCTATHIRFQDRLSYYVHRRRSRTRPSRPRKIRCERGTVCTLMADDANLEEPAGRVFRQVGARGPSKSADNMRKKGLNHFERFLSEKRLPPYEDLSPDLITI